MKISEKNIWLFGAGGACSWLISGFKREGVTIKGVLDDNPNVQSVTCDIPIYISNSKDITEETKQNDVIVVSILNSNININKIIEKLKKMGWINVIEYGSFIEKYFLETKKVLTPLDSQSWKENKKELNFVKTLFADDVSVRVFESFLKFVETGTNNFLPISKNQYFPIDLKRWSNKLNFIDCGAFNGDTLLEIKKEGYKINSAHAFEPDINNYKKLTKICKNIEHVHAWPCGVGDKNESIRFQTQDNMGSFADQNGNSVIQCVRLDDCLPSYSPNLIKMDIEGYELNALLGAENMLKEHNPGLAISVYHLSDDIWRIPIYLKNIYKNRANFYLRNHSRTIADTILYIIPL